MVESVNDLDERVHEVTSQNKQYDWISVQYENLPFPKKDEVWYLICSEWWQAHIIRGMPFTTLDNSSIIDPVTGSLKPDLSEGVGNDLIIVNHDLWHRIRSICDVVSGSEIERKVVEDSDGFMRVEIYPFDFQICVCDSAGKLRLSLVNGTTAESPWNLMTFSCKDPVLCIFDTVFKTLGIPREIECRWWRKPVGSLDSDPFELINLEDTCWDGEGSESITLDHINVVTRDFILVEPVNPDGTWPRDSTAVSQGAKKFYSGKAVLLYHDKWREGEIIEVDEQRKLVRIQLVDLPEELANWHPFDSERSKKKIR